MTATLLTQTLIAVLLLTLSGPSDAGRVGGRSSSSGSAAKSSASSTAARKLDKDEARTESGKGISVNFASGSGRSSAGDSSPAAPAAAAVAAGSATAATLSSEDLQRNADQQGRQMEMARLADEKRRAEAERKREEIDRLAKEAEEDRQKEALRKEQGRKRKEQLRQQARLESRCVLKPVMTDAEIARCR